MADGHEPIDDAELLFRRVPEQWYEQATKLLDEMAFRPSKERDLTGLSLWREKYKTVEQAAVGRPGKTYFVAVLRASDVRNAGMRIEPRPLPDDPGHCECPDLRADNYKETLKLERPLKLVELCLRVEGPYEMPPAVSAS